GPKPEEEEKNAAVVGALESSAAVLEESRELEQPAASAGRKVLATPAARQLARELGIELTAIRGTGPEGGVRKEDVLLARETRAEETGPETAALSSLAKTMAENMSLSKREIPQAAVLDEFDLSELVRFRNDAKEKAEQEGIKLTYMPFLIKALVLALQDYPSFNARFSPETNEIVFQKDYNIGIAVDSPDGLVVPVIKNAEQLSLLRLAEEVQNLAEKARRRTLTLEEIRGGTFSLTNYGAVGALSGLPIIKHPEAAILGMGKISPKPIADGQGQIVVKQMLPLTLVFDHRFIDGGGAGRFMARLKELLEEPLLLLLS
ncbi:MAG: 2-oxo acid dehydrogenase subunit E2, partial [Firmicutes bacterium]|nr:2-oxo acid dehydrogenase subunit E2 [Bacillota bacterium]